ncbi:MAG: AMP-binding protein [Trueperaceae bacterium]|nr:AMP-binding protein [Trueperaceae bacterium]
MLFLDQLFSNCRHYGDKLAIEFVQTDRTSSISYRDLEQQVSKAAAYLQRLGVSEGDRVALQLPKSLEFIYLHLAAMRLGAISLPLNPAFPASELEYFLSDSEAKVFFADARTEEGLEPMLSTLGALQHAIFIDLNKGLDLVAEPSKLPPLLTNPELTALMIYTSGTTGRPKGAELSHANLTANLSALHEAWQWQEDDVLLHVLPIFHTHGLMVALHGALHAGASTTLVEKFGAKETLELLLSRRFSVFMAVPTIHGRLLEEAGKKPYDLSFMRLMTSGSAGLPEDVFAHFKTTFNYTLLERYGMTETGMNLSNPYSGERRQGSVGLPLPGVEARVVDPSNETLLADGEIGEVQIRGPHVFKGYWRQAQKTAESFTPDGWLRTGDLGLKEKDGYYRLKGRSKDLIISGGFNVYPPEVELVLAEHPDIAASAVIGCPDKDWGEQVVAVVQAKPGSSLSEEEVIAFCREHLANYKAPKLVKVVSDLPRNAMGKVQKNLLRSEFCQKKTETA